MTKKKNSAVTSGDIDSISSDEELSNRLFDEWQKAGKALGASSMGTLSVCLHLAAEAIAYIHTVGKLPLEPMVTQSMTTLLNNIQRELGYDE